MSDRMLKAALRYAGFGWSVLPIHAVRKGVCSCGANACENQGKHPRTRHGVKEATTDKRTIRKWWEMWPSANVGIATGKRSNIVVLDIDPRHGGQKSLKGLKQQKGAIPPCPVANTGGGGKHLI